MSSIKSAETRLTYSIYFKKFSAFMGSVDLFCGKDAHKIADKIIEFIMDLKSRGKGYAAIHNYVSAILAFYKINDVILNISKINKFIPAQKKIKKDRAYTSEEISKFLEIGDERIRVAILLMCSSGVRVGALPSLKISSLEGSKLTVYEGYGEEYYTFITPECRKAIDSYLDMRKRYGEVLTPNSFLIREQFDTKDQFQIAKPRQLTVTMVKCKMDDLRERLGIKSKEIGVAITHGFRKFFATKLEESDVSPIKISMMLGHKQGLLLRYTIPAVGEVYREYEKAIDNLTINEEYRLRLEVQTLSEKGKDSEYIIRTKLEESRKEIQLLKENYMNDIDTMREQITRDVKKQVSELFTRLKPEIIREGMS